MMDLTLIIYCEDGKNQKKEWIIERAWKQHIHLKQHTLSIPAQNQSTKPKPRLSSRPYDGDSNSVYIISVPVWTKIIFSMNDSFQGLKKDLW